MSNNATKRIKEWLQQKYRLPRWAIQSLCNVKTQSRRQEGETST